MARNPKRTAEEIERLLSGYEQSGLSRRRYSEQQGIRVTTFDYYRQRQLKRERVPAATDSPLVRVKIANCPGVEQQEPKHFTLILAKGRRIESAWSYNEPDLARLIRIVEAA